MNKVLGIFSGVCLIGVVGQETNLFDRNGTRLFVGDMVRIIPKSNLPYLEEYNEEELYKDFEPVPVVKNYYNTYNNGKIVQTQSNSGWIMGWRNADLDQLDILKTGSHDNAYEGLSYSKFGSNFKLFDKETIEKE